mgnify:CR=1 FL=1
MTQRKKKRWENQELTAIGRREARTAFYEDSFSRISLNGKWQFLYLDAPELSPAGFEAPGAKEGWGYHRCSFRMAASGIRADALYRCIVFVPCESTLCSDRESDGYL